MHAILHEECIEELIQQGVNLDAQNQGILDINAQSYFV